RDTARGTRLHSPRRACGMTPATETHAMATNPMGAGTARQPELRHPLPADRLMPAPASSPRRWVPAPRSLVRRPRSFTWSIRMPLRFVRGTHARLALTVIAIACGVGLVCAIDLADRAVLRAFVQVADDAAGRVALQVRAGEGAPFPEEVVDTVGAVPGVELATPGVSGTAVPADGDGETLTVLGLDIADDEVLRAYGVERQRHRGAKAALELADPFLLVSQPDGIVLTRSFAARRGLAIGDRIAL